MALKSRTEILNTEANADGASNEAILMAALNESQQEYKRLSGKLLLAFESYDKRIEALEAAVRASNEKKVVDIKKTLEKASEAVMGDITANMGKFNTEIRQSTYELQTAKKEAKKKAAQEELKSFLIEFAVVVAAFYVALLLYGWWYDIPEAIGKLDAVNNGIYQLLNKP